MIGSEWIWVAMIWGAILPALWALLGLEGLEGGEREDDEERVIELKPEWRVEDNGKH